MDITLTWIFSHWALYILGIIPVLYFYGIRPHNYFLNKKVPFVKPQPFVGNIGPVIFQRMAFADLTVRWYNELKGYAYGGVFSFTMPCIFVRDPDLIKQITIKDFEYFTDHTNVIAEEIDPTWGKGLFNLRGERWRDMRSTLSPAFTSSKMKTMYTLMTECGKQLVDFLEKCCSNGVPEKHCKIEKEGDVLTVELKDLFTRYTNDVIATTAFGISVDSLKNPTNEFYLMGKEATKFGYLQMIKFMGHFVVPKLMKMFNSTLISKKAMNFFKPLIIDTMSTREREGIIRPDLVHLLMLARKGALQDENSPNDIKRVLDDDDLVAQAFTFFSAGFDAISTLICFTCHQIATHPEVMVQLQEEIDTAMKETKGNITYEQIHDMKYLDMVISETLRMYPPNVTTERRCTKPYKLPADPPIQMNPGDGVGIPIYALHHDPQYFPDPDQFRPERFSDENKHSIKPFTFLPFGSGPRNCIASRFALMEAKIAVANLLHRFNLKVVPKTPIPIKIAKTGLIITAEGGFWMGLEKRS